MDYHNDRGAFVTENIAVSPVARYRKWTAVDKSFVTRYRRLRCSSHPIGRDKHSVVLEL